MQNKSSRFWDDLYKSGRDYSDLTVNQEEIIFESLSEESIILDMGAGTGKLMKIGEYRGFIMEGFELSEEALKLARSKGVKGNLSIQNLEVI